MSNNQFGNVYQFPGTKKSTRNPGSEVLVGGTRGKVVDITEKQGGPIFWENDTNPESCALDFFRVLDSTGFVTIRCEGENIIENSILEVSSHDGEIFGMLVRDFIRLTHKNFRTIEDIDYAVLEWLGEKNIEVSLRQNDDMSHEERDLTYDESTWYKVEEIAIKVGNMEYKVELHFGDGIYVGQAEIEDFDTERNATLLDMILCALDDAETFNNITDLEGVTVDVIYTEDDDTSSTTHIAPELAEHVIYSALLRINNALYYEMTPVEARLHYFHHHVIPKLSGIKMV